MTVKKCPECYALMRGSIRPATSSVSQHQPSQSTGGIADSTTRYECSQCGNTEEGCAQSHLTGVRI
jgi:hypothetical protein